MRTASTGRSNGIPVISGYRAKLEYLLPTPCATVAEMSAGDAEGHKCTNPPLYHQTLHAVLQFPDIQASDITKCRMRSVCRGADGR